MKLLIKNIKGLIQVEDAPKHVVKGKDMKQLAVIEDAYLAIEDGVIVDFGNMEEWPGISDWINLNVIDADGKFVFPCWCDSHTHIVYAGSREGEFVDRINGLSYQEIANRGGGILNSAKKLASAGEDELFESAKKRITEVIKMGTGALEIKSGYGLSTEAELKMLRVIKKLKNHFPIPIRATFLGAHAVPAEYKENKQAYIDLIINEMLPAIAKEELADYCDVFCETGYFTKDETVKILTAAKSFGLQPKVHANQLNTSGGVQAGTLVDAVSVDHLEYVGEEEISALKKSNTIPTVLPGAQYFLKLPEPPARKMIDAGLALAIASDFNPGSSPNGNMNWMISHACVNYGMTPEEAINAATINSSYAMGLSQTHGSICVGKMANVFITKEMPSYAYLPYSFGMNMIETVIINGEIF